MMAETERTKVKKCRVRLLDCMRMKDGKGDASDAAALKVVPGRNLPPVLSQILRNVRQKIDKLEREKEKLSAKQGQQKLNEKEAYRMKVLKTNYKFCLELEKDIYVVLMKHETALISEKERKKQKHRDSKAEHWTSMETQDEFLADEPDEVAAVSSEKDSDASKMKPQPEHQPSCKRFKEHEKGNKEKKEPVCITKYDGTVKTDGKDRKYKIGTFLARRSDLKVTKFPHMIWFVDTPSLLLRFEAVNERGKTVYEHTPVFSPWLSESYDQYQEILVKVLDGKGKPKRVELEFNFDTLEKSETEALALLDKDSPSDMVDVCPEKNVDSDSEENRLKNMDTSEPAKDVEKNTLPTSVHEKMDSSSFQINDDTGSLADNHDDLTFNGKEKIETGAVHDMLESLKASCPVFPAEENVNGEGEQFLTFKTNNSDTDVFQDNWKFMKGFAEEFYPDDNKTYKPCLEASLEESGTEVEEPFSAIDSFNTYVQALISQCLELTFLPSLYKDQDRQFIPAIKKIDSILHEKCKKKMDLQWTDSFKMFLSTQPILSFQPHDLGKDSDSCDICGNASAYHMKLSGNMYDKLTLKLIGINVTQEYWMCSQCKRKVELYHKMTHYKFELKLRCQEKVDDLKPSFLENDLELVETLMKSPWLGELYREFQNVLSKKF